MVKSKNSVKFRVDMSNKEEVERLAALCSERMKDFRVVTEFDMSSLCAVDVYGDWHEISPAQVKRGMNLRLMCSSHESWGDGRTFDEASDYVTLDEVEAFSYDKVTKELTVVASGVCISTIDISDQIREKAHEEALAIARDRSVLIDGQVAEFLRESIEGANMFRYDLEIQEIVRNATQEGPEEGFEIGEIK